TYPVSASMTPTFPAGSVCVPAVAAVVAAVEAIAEALRFWIITTIAIAPATPTPAIAYFLSTSPTRGRLTFPPSAIYAPSPCVGASVIRRQCGSNGYLGWLLVFCRIAYATFPDDISSVDVTVGSLR